MSNKKYTNHIIAVDLDETLLNSKGQISNRTKNTLSKCKELGVKIVVSSARGYGTCKNISAEISADYICCQAGNMIVDGDDKIIYSNALDKTEVSAFIDHFSKFTNYFIMDSTFNLYGGTNDKFCKSWGVIHCDINNLKELDVYKIFIYFEDSYKQEIENYCKARGFICHEMRGAPMMFVSPPKSDKFFALEKLMSVLNTNANNLIVFGDDYSDLLSIQKAGIGVAVANSKPEVLESAQFNTLSNDEDGVALFLEKHFNI